MKEGKPVADSAKAKLHRYTLDVVLAPGDTLEEVLEAMGMTQAELAKRTGLSAKHVNQIIKGVAPITPDTSLLLERVTNVPARIWNNLEVSYREHISRRDENLELAKDIGWLAELPVKELIKRGRLKAGLSQVEQVRSVCEFFGVANKRAWMELWDKPTAFRKSKAFASDPAAVAAWLRIGELEAAEIDCAPFDRAGLAAALGELRALTSEPTPRTWWPKLVSTCAAVGVAVVVEKEIPGSRVNGAARWLTPTKALVQLSLRHRWADIFWFTFFHECGHLLLHSKKETFINDTGAHSGAEQEADAFASTTLIPPEREYKLSSLSSFDDVRAFAADLGISPGIVVGRLQHDGRWAFSRGNDLKQRFVFVDE
jgi:HTH-type transcriptional regulator/antitoxin HigA